MRQIPRLALVTTALCMAAASAAAGPRLDSIRRKGVLTCGVAPGVAGFAEVTAQGRDNVSSVSRLYRGLDVDICRALAAAIFGSPDKVKFVLAASVAEFSRAKGVDIVSRRLTWSLARETPVRMLFGPVMFYDGQSFLVRKTLGAKTVRQLSGVPVCVAAGTPAEFNVSAYFDAHQLALKEIAIAGDEIGEIGRAFADERCPAYSADTSMLGSIRSRLPRPDDFDILPEQISKEPLAQLVRDDDAQFFDILRWTVFALIDAEELGVTSSNIDQMLKSGNADVQRLLGVMPGNGKALGLDEKWAYNVIKALGNYGEMFERNVGSRSPIKLERGANRLWTEGGLLYAPPLR